MALVKSTVATAWGPIAIAARASQRRPLRRRMAAALTTSTGTRKRPISSDSTSTIWVEVRTFVRPGRKYASDAHMAAATVTRTVEPAWSRREREVATPTPRGYRVRLPGYSVAGLAAGQAQLHAAALDHDRLPSPSLVEGGGQDRRHPCDGHREEGAPDPEEVGAGQQRDQCHHRVQPDRVAADAGRQDVVLDHLDGDEVEDHPGHQRPGLEERDDHGRHCGENRPQHRHQLEEEGQHADHQRIADA